MTNADICYKYLNGISQKKLAIEYGVSQQQIKNIILACGFNQTNSGAYAGDDYDSAHKFNKVGLNFTAKDVEEYISLFQQRRFNSFKSYLTVKYKQVQQHNQNQHHKQNINRNQYQNQYQDQYHNQQVTYTNNNKDLDNSIHTNQNSNDDTTLVLVVSCTIFFIGLMIFAYIKNWLGINTFLRGLFSNFIMNAILFSVLMVVFNFISHKLDVKFSNGRHTTLRGIGSFILTYIVLVYMWS